MNGNRIFVVDDDPNALRLIAVNLEARGYKTLSFRTGTRALSQLERSTPDLVILDIALPGVDGMELTRRLRKISAVPIIVVSAKAEGGTRQEALELGADDYITKPFGVEELLARIRAILRSSGGPYPVQVQRNC